MVKTYTQHNSRLPLIRASAAFLSAAAPVSAASNVTPETAVVLAPGTTMLEDTGTHHGHGNLWYAIRNPSSTGAWFELAGWISSPANRGGFMVAGGPDPNAALIDDSSYLAAPGATGRCRAFIPAGGQTYGLLLLNASGDQLSSDVTFHFTANRMSFTAAPNPLLITDAAPFTVEGMAGGTEEPQVFRYTAPEAGKYNFTLSMDMASGFWVWLVDPWWPDGDRSENASPLVFSDTLAAGATTVFSLFQRDPYGNDGAGVPLRFTLSATREAVLPSTDYASWTGKVFPAADAANAAISGPLADPDHDGLSNLTEYAFGLQPTALSAGDAALPRPILTDGRLSITFRRPKDRTGLTWTVESSTDATLWQSGPAFTEAPVITDLGNEESLTIRAVAPAPAARRQWLRVKVDLAQPPE